MGQFFKRLKHTSVQTLISQTTLSLAALANCMSVSLSLDNSGLTVAPHSEVIFPRRQSTCQDHVVGIDQQLVVSVCDNGEGMCFMLLKEILRRQKLVSASEKTATTCDHKFYCYIEQLVTYN